ncbi:unnamed protein product, partial [Tetraodon nigroviridis]
MEPSRPWRNSSVLGGGAEPPLSEQGETIIGVYLLLLGWLSWFGNTVVLFVLVRQRSSLQPTDLLTFNLAVSDASISVFGYSRGIIQIFNVFQDSGFIISSIWTCEVSTVICTAFILAWSPYAVVSMWSACGFQVPSLTSIFTRLFAKSASFYNPLIYFGLSSKFRRDA